MTINKLTVTYVLDKETYLPTKLDMMMDFAMDISGQSIKTITNIHADYTGFNNVKEIKVPDEAKKAQ
jgi:hypothetical protein